MFYISPSETWLMKLPESLRKRPVEPRTLSNMSDALGKNWTLLMEIELGLKVCTYTEQ